MKLLVRTLTPRGRSVATSQERLLEGRQFTLGRGTDQDIYLPSLRVALHHATVSEGNDGRLRLRSDVPSGFQHNGELVQQATLAPGDQLKLGGTAMSLEPGGAEADLVLVIHPVRAGRGQGFAQALSARSPMSLRALGLRQRPLAVGLFLSVLALFLIVPVGGALSPQVNALLRPSPLPSDHAWVSGPTSPSHRAFAGECEACHQRPFQMSTNAACLQCHEGVGHHVGAQALAAGQFEQARCGGCHHEHGGALTLVRRDPQQCAACHREPGAGFSEADFGPVEDFGELHPQFRASLPRRDAAGQALVERVSLDRPDQLRESGNLLFSHRAHFKEGGLRTAENGRVELGCADCHQPEPGGGLMAPVSFERHCGQCHALTIPGDVARETPHGDLDAAIGAVQDYFHGWALRGGYPNALAPESVWRRRPGREPTAAERREALAWARESAALAVREMLQYTTCATCHRVERRGGGWSMAPVDAVRQWFPGARFSHAGHDTMACKDCHQGARESDSQDDVLMAGAGIEACRTCHGGVGAPEGRVASACIDCHGFHQPLPPMAAATGAAPVSWPGAGTDGGSAWHGQSGGD